LIFDHRFIIKGRAGCKPHAQRERRLGAERAQAPGRVASYLERVLLLIYRRLGKTAMAITTVEQTSALASPEDDSETALGLIRHLLEEVSLLFRQEVRLATAEVSHRLTTLVTGVTSVAAAAAVLFCGLLVLLAAAVLALALAMPAWLAALVVGVLCIIVGFALLSLGRAKFRATNLKPERSVESLAKDKDVLARRTT
jgi:hypothetical protein